MTKPPERIGEATTLVVARCEVATSGLATTRLEMVYGACATSGADATRGDVTTAPDRPETRGAECRVVIPGVIVWYRATAG